MRVATLLVLLATLLKIKIVLNVTNNVRHVLIELNTIVFHVCQAFIYSLMGIFLSALAIA